MYFVNVENCFLIHGQVFPFVDLHRVLISTICIFRILDFHIIGNAGQPAREQASLQQTNFYVIDMVTNVGHITQENLVHFTKKSQKNLENLGNLKKILKILEILKKSRKS